MKIVILDGYTLNPGDLSWQPLQQFGELISYERTRSDQVVLRAKGADVIFTNKTVLDNDVLSQLPQLKFIGLFATGTNVVDLYAATNLGLVVTNAPAYAPDAVAQMVFAHILHHSQRVADHHKAVIEGAWSTCEDFCFTLSPLQSLKDKTMGIIGYGAIGQQVATIALAFGMKVLINTRTKPARLPLGMSWCDLDSIFSSSDILTLHCPLTPATDKLINANSLKLMKPSAILINSARGGLIDEAALQWALNTGEIAAAGVDVLSTEPPEKNNPLLRAKNISISPHNSWATIEARLSLLNIVSRNLASYLKGEKDELGKYRNQVN
ncbi:MAG: D-2-hydroxyacid dehydrogenase [Shewanella sp.]